MWLEPIFIARAHDNVTLVLHIIGQNNCPPLGINPVCHHESAVCEMVCVRYIACVKTQTIECLAGRECHLRRTEPLRNGALTVCLSAPEDGD